MEGAKYVKKDDRSKGGQPAKQAAPVKTEKRSNKPSIPKWKSRTADTHQAIMHYLATDGKDSEVVMLGSSMFERFKTSGKQAWDDLNFDRFKICNAGVGGDSTENVLWRLEDGKMFENYKPRLVVLMIGTNNIEKDHPEDISNAVFAIIEKIKKDSPNSRILLIGMLTRNDPKSLLSKIIQLNTLLKNRSSESAYQDLTYAEFPRFLLKDDDTPRKELFDDHVHINSLGYRLFGEQLDPVISNLLHQ